MEFTVEELIPCKVVCKYWWRMFYNLPKRPVKAIMQTSLSLSILDWAIDYFDDGDKKEKYAIKLHKYAEYLAADIVDNDHMHLIKSTIKHNNIPAFEMIMNHRKEEVNGMRMAAIRTGNIAWLESLHMKKLKQHELDLVVKMGHTGIIDWLKLKKTLVHNELFMSAVAGQSGQIFKSYIMIEPPKFTWFDRLNSLMIRYLHVNGYDMKYIFEGLTVHEKWDEMLDMICNDLISAMNAFIIIFNKGNKIQLRQILSEFQFSEDFVYPLAFWGPYNKDKLMIIIEFIPPSPMVYLYCMNLNCACEEIMDTLLSTGVKPKGIVI